MSAANVQIQSEVFVPVATDTVMRPLRFTTAGSVDDGKSTLIGRLLYDSQAVYEDQLASVKKSRINRSTGPIDFSLLTDGLRAEREQGITIDVAYRYFSTPRRKFIIADTPGHEQYTRNMATGASTADAAIVLLDATKGLLPQSRRHAYIASLLGIKYVIAAVNKMDLVNYSSDVFHRLEKEFQELAEQLNLDDVYVIPISALEGDNVVRRSSRTSWFHGPALLQYLEELPSADDSVFEGPMRFPIQYVIRPDQNFRGFAGQLESGTISVGDEVVALPTGIRARVKSIVTYDGELAAAHAGDAVTITFHEEVDLSRGDLLVNAESVPWVGRTFDSKLVWMHSDALDTRKLYLLKHTTKTVRAHVTAVHHRIDVNTLAKANSTTLRMNDIAHVEIQTTLPLVFDPYARIQSTGSFILIDPITNATVAAGMIEGPSETAAGLSTDGTTNTVTNRDRRDRFGHGSAGIWVEDNRELAQRIERSLFDHGSNVHLIEAEAFNGSELAAIAKAFKASGVAAVFAAESTKSAAAEQVAAIFGELAFFRVLADANDGVAADIHHQMTQLHRRDQGGQS
jgi:sulfate adenylyltransferase large subunit